jgi:hypothetical protein
MHRKSLICLALGLFFVSLLWGQSPPEKKADKAPEKAPEKPAIDPAAQRLVEQLADLDFHKRDEAARLLEAMGEKALPALRAARKHTDPEVRRQAAALLEPIETATLLAPKRVTLTLEKKSAAEVLQAIGTQSGYQIDLTAGPAPAAGRPPEQFTFRWKDVPFWQAVDEVSRAAGLTILPNYGDTRLHLQSRNHYAPYVSQAGAFCLTAGGFQQTKTVDFSSFPLNNPEVTRWNETIFVFTVHAEPRLPLLSLGEPHLTAAYDNEGNSMIPQAGAAKDQPNPQLFGYRPGRASYGGSRMLSLNSQLNLTRPSHQASSVKQLKGTLPVTTLVEQKAEVVTDNLVAAKGKKFHVGTTTFAIEDVSETPTKQPQVRMTISEDAASVNGPNDYTWMNSLWNRLEVYDDKGQRVMNNSSSWGGGTNSVNMTLTYAAGSKPTKLVYQVWTTLSCQIAFEFKGLPLP